MNILNFKILIKDIQNEIKETNKKQLLMNKYRNLPYEDKKEFYLLDKEWANKYRKGESLKIEIGEFQPSNFLLLEKNEPNESRFKNLNIHESDIFIYKIFFTYGNEFKKNFYFGFIENIKNIFFYSIKDNYKYNLEYSLKFASEEKMEKEIKENILIKGIDAYLYDMEIDFSNNQEFQELCDIKLKQIGQVLILNKKVYGPITYSKDLEEFKYSDNFNAIIQCLVNIKYLKIIFKRKDISKRINIIRRKVTKIFYKIMQYMWHYNELGIKEKYIEFLFQLKDLSGKQDILNNIDSLIKFLLLAIHLEQSTEKNIEINYHLYNLENEFHKEKDSLIKKLFFVKYESVNKCKKCKKNIIRKDCILFINIKDFKRINSNMKNFNLNSIFLFKHEFLCEDCNESINSEIKFINFPQILIIIFQDLEKNQLELKEELKLEENEKYKLISVIFENEKESQNNQTKKNKILITYCKSPVNAKWYEYGVISNYNDRNKQNVDFNSIKQKNFIPSLLIYQKNNKTIKEKNKE